MMLQMAQRRTRLDTVGWREWARLPDFGVPAIKVKIDTGARTSALHAFKLRLSERHGRQWAHFEIHPHQRSAAGAVRVECPVVGRRRVRSSNGDVEERPVIRTTIELAGVRWPVDITLTNRDEMGFRMLIGRAAVRRRFVVDPSRSYLGGGSPDDPDGRRRNGSTARSLSILEPVPVAQPVTTAETARPWIAGRLVDPGVRAELELRPAQLPSGGWMTIPVVVTSGVDPGPTVWLSAAIHGDEVCGVEIIRQVLTRLWPTSMRGTVVAVPVVNVPGFASGDRYMPDRRDLNRCFPGSPRGSLASRFANVFMNQIVRQCDLGIDLHTGSDHRRNLPQIRADLDDAETRDLARVFGAPAAVHSRLRDGSLREAAVRDGIITLVYEGGEAWRFDDDAIETGVAGVMRVLAHVGVLDPGGEEDGGTERPTVEIRRSQWLRSPQSGVARVMVDLGQEVDARTPVAVVADAVGNTQRVLRASRPGLVIGRSELPVVHRGDALVHLGHLDPAASGRTPTPQ